jgi:hypothetical protein
MTPKEKAKELFNKIVVYHWTDVCDYEGAKQCALIAVDEIFKTVSMCIPYRNESTYSNYWQEVKQEIEKL